MLSYHISCQDPESKFIQLRFHVSGIHQDFIHIQLPAWRPGRYELQHFAKNIRKFSVHQKNGSDVPYAKLTKDRWEIHTKGIEEIDISYEYYANQPDAGGSFVSEEFLYINPVNCMMYVEGRMEEPYEVYLQLPPDYRLATQMEETRAHTLYASNFDYLADSPIIASDLLECYEIMGEYEQKPYVIKLWFQGKHPFDIERMKRDTHTYVAYQIDRMGDMPCDSYHFLYLMHDKPFRHGVEHLNSTVIAMGQLEDQTVEEFYNDLLAISSHEFFHLWNIKRIRPVEMLPYDYTKENYSSSGFVYEGATTYLGDLILLHAGVWTQEQYINSLSSDLYRHYTNEGRFHYSLADSSWDTWLDGYVAGVKGRKISIYIEGLIVSWCMDVALLEATQGSKRLYDVFRFLNQEYARQQKGYTPSDFQQAVERIGGISCKLLFDELVYGRGNFEKWILQTSERLGVKMELNSIRNKLTISISDSNNPLLTYWLNT